MGRGPHSRPSDRDKRAVAEPHEAVTSWETDRVWDGLHRVHWGPGPSRPATWRVSCFGGAAPNKPAEPEHVSLPRATPPEVLGREAASDRRRADTDVGALRLSDVCERPAALALDVPEVGHFKATFLWPQTSAALLPRRGPLVARGQQTPVAAKLAAGADASRTRWGWEQPSALPVAGAHRGVTGVGTGGAAECSALSSN